jgi:hypothetical protein
MEESLGRQRYVQVNLPRDFAKRSQEPELPGFAFPHASSSTDYEGYSSPSSTYESPYGHATASYYGSEGSSQGGSYESSEGEPSESSPEGESPYDPSADLPLEDSPEGDSSTDVIITLTSTSTSTQFT